MFVVDFSPSGWGVFQILSGGTDAVRVADRCGVYLGNLTASLNQLPSSTTVPRTVICITRIYVASIPREPADPPDDDDTTAKTMAQYENEDTALNTC